jgi:hypothetical protein
MSISTEELAALVTRVRGEAAAAGELRPERIGPIALDLPEDIRQAILADLALGEYRRAADEAMAGDPDMQQP